MTGSFTVDECEDVAQAIDANVRQMRKRIEAALKQGRMSPREADHGREMINRRAQLARRFWAEFEMLGGVR